MHRAKSCEARREAFGRADRSRAVRGSKRSRRAGRNFAMCRSTARDVPIEGTVVAQPHPSLPHRESSPKVHSLSMRRRMFRVVLSGALARPFTSPRRSDARLRPEYRARSSPRREAAMRQSQDDDDGIATLQRSDREPSRTRSRAFDEAIASLRSRYRAHVLCRGRRGRDRAVTGERGGGQAILPVRACGEP